MNFRQFLSEAHVVTLHVSDKMVPGSLPNWTPGDTVLRLRQMAMKKRRLFMGMSGGRDGIYSFTFGSGQEAGQFHAKAVRDPNVQSLGVTQRTVLP